jgi:dihydroorotate dehydrogenase (fumarate)
MDITTKYLGMELRSPLVVSASPLTEDVVNFRKMEDAGAGAIVMHSLFEEQIVLEEKALHFSATEGDNLYAESTSFFPNVDEYRLGPDEYLDLIKKAKDVVKIPVIASLNGSTVGGWTKFAAKMEAAGADAIELNDYFIPTDPSKSGPEIEEMYLRNLKAVKEAVKIPVALKLSPYFSNMAYMAKKFDEAGADALVLFNRFYQPDIDLENLEIKPHIDLSSPYDGRLSLTWIGILRGKIKADLAATRGVHTGKDAIKMLLAGANVVMTTSSLLKNGIDHLKTIEEQMVKWLEEKEYESVKQMIGSMSQEKVADQSAFERAQYMKALVGYQYKM